MSVELTREEWDVARGVATSALGRYRGYAQRDDIQQELYAWMLTHEPQLLRWREQEHGVRGLRLRLEREAQHFCEREKAARVGYEPGDNQGYPWSLVQELLPLALRDNWWELKMPAKVGKENGRVVQATSGFESTPPVPIEIVDVRRGLQVLNQRDPHSAELLAQAGIHKMEWEYLAYLYSTEDYAPTTKAMRDRVRRAAKKLARVLSEPRSGHVYRGIPRRSNAGVIRQQLEEAA